MAQNGVRFGASFSGSAPPTVLVAGGVKKEFGRVANVQKKPARECLECDCEGWRRQSLRVFVMEETPGSIRLLVSNRRALSRWYCGR